MNCQHRQHQVYTIRSVIKYILIMFNYCYFKQDILEEINGQIVTSETVLLS